MDKNILMPRIGANDDFVVLAQWYVHDGDFVNRRQPIANLESTKETTELFAPIDGFIRLKVEELAEVKVGTVVAIISEGSLDIHNDETSAMKDSFVGIKITEKAKKLVKQNNIDIDRLPKGKLIRERDIEALIGSTFSIAETVGNSLIVYGTGGFTREIIHITKQFPLYKIAYVVAGMGDWKDKEQILGVPVIKAAVMGELYNQGYTKIVNAVAVTPGAFSRKEIFASLKEKHYEFPNIVDKSVLFGENVSMGEGNIIFAGAVIGSEVKIGNNCVINQNCTLSHGNIISDSCHIASGAVLAGDVVVGENTLIGQNSTIYSGVHVGKNVVIHNGCSIYKDVPDGTVVKL